MRSSQVANFPESGSSANVAATWFGHPTKQHQPLKGPDGLRVAVGTGWHRSYEPSGVAHRWVSRTVCRLQHWGFIVC